LPSTIERVQREYGPRGLSVLAISDEAPGVVAPWVTARGLTSTVLLDPGGAVMKAYRVTGTPTVYLVGRDGRLVGKAVGTREWTGPAGRALFEALLAAR
jgi:peroxiredoxin